MLRRMNALASIAFALSILISTGAIATAQRTFVASNGNDANPCSLVLPCRGFAAAIAQTATEGEVIVLDSAGYGPVAITRSVSITAPAGVYGGVTVPGPNGTGIDINGSNIKVALRGLSIIGQGGETGIQFSQGSRLTILDCEIAEVANGIDAAAANSVVTVRNTVIRDVLYGYGAIGTAESTLDGLHIVAKYVGVSATYGARVTVTNTVVVMLGGWGISSWANSGDTTDVMVSHSTISGGNYGLGVNALPPVNLIPGGTARVVSDGNVINNTKIAAFYFVGSGGTELIYTNGTTTLGSNVAATVVGGTLTPIGMY
jgi:hypothetical protein